jgi:hypothetical protein
MAGTVGVGVNVAVAGRYWLKSGVEGKYSVTLEVEQARLNSTNKLIKPISFRLLEPAFDRLKRVFIIFTLEIEIQWITDLRPQRSP